MADSGGIEGFVDFEQFHSALDEMNLLECKGSIVRVSGFTVESSGPAVGLGQLCRICLRDGRVIQAEVVGFKGGHLVLLPLEHIDGISPGDTVISVNELRYINLDESVMGRVLDGLGRPMDGKGALLSSERRPFDSGSPAPLTRKMISEPLSLVCGRFPVC